MTTDGAPPTPGPSCSQVHYALGVILDSLNKQLSGAHCWPSTGTDPGHTETSQAWVPPQSSGVCRAWELVSPSAGCLDMDQAVSFRKAQMLVSVVLLFGVI